MTDFSSLSVDLGEASYPIHIDKGLLPRLPSLIPMDLSKRRVFVLYDKNTYPYAQTIEAALESSCGGLKMFPMAGGEPTKSLDGYALVMGWLLDHKVTRHDVLLALGGGVIGDLGGYVAATVLRGIPFIQVPTTLLAQVDSSVGGKTGINMPQGKNLVGAFYQPRAVICDLDVLQTLPERELKAGYAEIVKYGLINDEDFFHWLESGNGQALLSLHKETLTHAIYQSCASKAAIVGQDEKEQGIRALLNLGHTFAHALEAAAKYDGRLLHGEAVAIGLVLAHELSAAMGLCSQEVPGRIAAHFKQCGLKTAIRDIHPPLSHSPSALLDLMAGDKKAQGDGKIGFILSRGIGQAFQTADVDQTLVLKILENSF